MSRYHLSIQTAPHNARTVPQGWTADSIGDAIEMARQADAQWMSVRLIDGETGREIPYRAPIEFRARVRCFGGPLQERRVKVDADGTVRVWDSVAGHYVICHSLSDAQERRLRKLAEVH